MSLNIDYLYQLEHFDEISFLSISTDRKYIISGCKNGYIYKWDYEKKILLNVFKKHHTLSIILLSITYDSKYLISICEEGIISIWNINTCELIKSSKDNINLDGIFTISNDMRYIISCIDNNEIDKSYLSIWELDTGNKIYEIETKSIHKLCTSHNDKYIICGNVDNTISIINFYTGVLEHEYKLDLENIINITCITIIENNKYILIGNDLGIIYLLDTENGKIKNKYSCVITDITIVYSIYMTDDMKRIIVGTCNGRINIFEVDTGKLLSRIRVHNNYVQSLKYTSDMRYIITGSYDNNIRIWDYNKIINSEIDDR